MKKIIGIHAHDSNSSYLEALFCHETAKEHVVVALSETLAQQKKSLEEVMERYLTTDVGAFFITCTVYSSLIEETEFKGIPIFKMDDPMIDTIVTNSSKKLLFFSNPETVALTMKKIESLYREKEKSKDYQVILIPDCFHLIMAGQQGAYSEAIKNALRPYLKSQVKIFLMQLSMSLVEGDSEFDSVQSVFSIAKAVYN